MKYLSVLALTLAACATDQMSSQDADALYLKRFARLQAGNPSANYDPMEPVAGAAHYQPLPFAAASERSIDASALAEAGDYARNSNAAAFMVWRKGKIEDAAYFGETTSETPINAMSLAKPLAVIAIGRAIALGKIKSLDQPVADFITEWRGTPKAAILIGQLLQMRSGLAPQDFTAGADTAMNRAYLHPFHDKILIADYPLTDPPGTRYAYSNASAELVAIIIERATGLRYARFVGDAVLGPIGAMGGAVWVDRPAGLAHSGCCIFLPAETWLRLGILVLRGGVWDGKPLLGKDFLRAMTSPTEENPYAAMAGVYVAGRYTARRGFSGVGQAGPRVLHSEPYLARDLMLFDGNADQVVYIVPSADLVALRLGSAPPKTPEWDNTTIPNLLLRGIDWQGRPPPPQPAG